MRRVWMWTAGVVLGVVIAGSARGLMINLSYVPPGENFGNSPTQFAVSPPNNPGGGNLHAIMRAAADVWQRALPGDFTIDVEYGWQALTGNTVGLHFGRGVEFVNGATRNKASWVSFNADFGSWYFDADPTDHREYRGFSQSDGDYGGVRVNDERRYTNPRPRAARGLDLFTVALHELGHAVGWTFANLADYRRDTGRDNDVRVASGLPGAGAVVEREGTHPDGASTMLMSPTISLGERVLPSVLDIVTAATISRYPDARVGLGDLLSPGLNEGRVIDVQLPDGTTTRVNLGRVFDLPEPASAVVWGLVFLACAARRTRG